MLIKYNIDKNPLIFVEFLDEIDINDDSYHNFMKFWTQKYELKNNFSFIMNLSNLTRPNLFLIKDFSRKIYNFKTKYQKQFLDFSIIILENSFIRNILDYLWMKNGILNNIYLVKDEKQAYNLLNILQNKNYNQDFIKSYCYSNKIILKEP